jgi:hypothetical protein
MILMGHHNRQRRRRLQWALALLVLTAAGGRVTAEELPWGVDQEEPVWLPYLPQLEYIKMEADVKQSSYQRAGGATTDWSQVTLMSAVGIKWQSYIYHPDLLNYSLVLEPEYRWQRSGGSNSPALTRELVLNGSAGVNLLTVKPYATSVSFGRSHAEVQSDFFNSQTLDRQSWSLVSGYRAGAVPVTLTVEQSREDRSSISQDFVTKQLKIGLHAVYDRKSGDSTVMDYQFNRYANQSNAVSGSYSSQSSSHHVLVTDIEHFKSSTLSSILNLNEREAAGLSSTDVNTFLNYNLTLAPHLSNIYTYSFSDSLNDGSSYVQHSVTAGLNHQLYESLFSHLDLHGLRSTNQSAGANLNSSNYGIATSVSYNKRLGNWGHLGLGNSVSFELTDQQSSGGELTIPDESYTIPAVGPMIIRLKTRADRSITSITKNNVPLDASEWTAITTSDPWQIQFISGGAHSVTNGDVVVITYVVQPNPSGKYSTRAIASDIAFRFWHDQAGIRANYLTTKNHADSPGFVLQDIEQYQLGADVGWHGFHVDASYLNQRSTLYSYASHALSESYSRPLASHSTVGLNFYQQRNDFPAGRGSSTQPAQSLTYYSYMLHFDWRPSGNLGLNAEAGLRQQRGSLQDQNLFAARIYLNWILGKLEMHLGYEHENNQYVRDVYGRHYAFLKMRRNF